MDTTQGNSISQRRRFRIRDKRLLNFFKSLWSEVHIFLAQQGALVGGSIVLGYIHSSRHFKCSKLQTQIRPNNPQLFQMHSSKLQNFAQLDLGKPFKKNRNETMDISCNVGWFSSASDQPVYIFTGHLVPTISDFIVLHFILKMKMYWYLRKRIVLWFKERFWGALHPSSPYDRYWPKNLTHLPFPTSHPPTGSHWPAGVRDVFLTGDPHTTACYPLHNNMMMWSFWQSWSWY